MLTSGRTSKSAAEILPVAQLLSGRRIDATGGFVPLGLESSKTVSLAALPLFARQFQVSGDQHAVRWHWRESFDFFARGQGQRAMWHLKCLADHNPDMPRCYEVRAGLFAAQGQWDAAAGDNRKAIAMLRERLGNDHVDLAAALESLAILERNLEHSAEAESALEEALQILRKQWGSKHLDVARTLERLAAVVAGRGETERGIALARESLEIRAELVGPVTDLYATSLLLLAALYQQSGDLGEATPLYHELLVLYSKNAGRDESRLFGPLSALNAIIRQRASAIGVQLEPNATLDQPAPEAKPSEIMSELLRRVARAVIEGHAEFAADLGYLVECRFAALDDAEQPGVAAEDIELAIAAFTKLIDERAKKEFTAGLAACQNELAWFYATCLDARHRNGKKAIALATKACEATGWKEFIYLDTLAAASAENGDFQAASKWQTKALEAAPPSEQAALQAQLEQYKAGRPYQRARLPDSALPAAKPSP